MNNDEKEELQRLREKHWSSRSDQQKESNYFILVDTKQKLDGLEPDSWYYDKIDEFMEQVFKENLDSIVSFNNTKKRKHHWSKNYIDDVSVRYAVEIGHKNQTLHLHIVLRIQHHSNISVKQEPINELATDFFLHTFGKKPFVAKPRLISVDKVEDYITKDRQFEHGVDWVPVKRKRKRKQK